MMGEGLDELRAWVRRVGELGLAPEEVPKTGKQREEVGERLEWPGWFRRAMEGRRDVMGEGRDE
jgi:hypothetical protein